MDSLPEELIIKLFLMSDNPEIEKICEVNKRARHICGRFSFWREKLSHIGTGRENIITHKSVKYLIDLYKRIYRSGYLYTLGKGNDGELGLGNIKNATNPTKVVGFDNITQVSCGSTHTAFITQQGELYTFGSNWSGALGTGDNISHDKPFKIVTFKDGDNFSSLVKIKQLSCSMYNTALVTDEGHIYITGAICSQNLQSIFNYEYGITHINIFTRIPNFDNVKQVSCGYDYISFITYDGSLYLLGRRNENDLGLYRGITKVDISHLKSEDGEIKQVSCGASHIACITNSNNLYVLGKNEDGQLGLKSKTDRKILTKVSSFNNNVQDVSCGYNHTVVLTTEGKLYTFGVNNDGQLGTGDKKKRHGPTLVSSAYPVIAIAGGTMATDFVDAKMVIHVLGIGNRLPKLYTAFEEKEEIFQIACGEVSHAILIRKQ